MIADPTTLHTRDDLLATLVGTHQAYVPVTWVTTAATTIATTTPDDTRITTLRDDLTGRPIGHIHVADLTAWLASTTTTPLYSHHDEGRTRVETSTLPDAGDFAAFTAIVNQVAVFIDHHRRWPTRATTDQTGQRPTRRAVSAIEERLASFLDALAGRHLRGSLSRRELDVLNETLACWDGWIINAQTPALYPAAWGLSEYGRRLATLDGFVDAFWRAPRTDRGPYEADLAGWVSGQINSPASIDRARVLALLNTLPRTRRPEA